MKSMTLQLDNAPYGSKWYLRMPLIFLLILLFSLAAFSQVKTPIYSQKYINDKDPIEVEVNVFEKTEFSKRGLDDNQNAQTSMLPSYCNMDSEIVAINQSVGDSLDDVGCQPGDLLEICFKINYYGDGGSSQWFHGLVPDFGDCLEVLPTPEGEPGIITMPMTNNTGIGFWEWYPDDIVTYNLGDGPVPYGEPVGAGWFYTGYVNSSTLCGNPVDPNCSWGDFNSTNGASWEVCFEAFPICTGPGSILCEISFKTYSDGETGGYTSPGCQLDEPIVYEFLTHCCDQPIILNDTLDFTVCSGDLFELELISDMDPITTYEWTVDPNPHGATSGSGTVITDVLTNFTSDPVTVTYEVTPTCDQGCIGERVYVNVTINPEVEVIITPQNATVCAGECITLESIIVSNSTYQGCDWNTGQSNTSSITVCPQGTSEYEVVVTDINGCTGTANTIVEVYYPPYVSILASEVEVCENDSDYPITLTANIFSSSGPVGIQWSTGETSESIIVTESGNYSVTVFDLISGCPPAYDAIDITIHPLTSIYINGQNEFCPNDGIVCFNGSPSGGFWTGDVDASGCADVGTLGTGNYSIVYIYQDNNGCSNGESFNFSVSEEVGIPQQLPNDVICEGSSNSIYSIDEVSFASSYLWTIDGSGEIVSGQGTTSIEVEWSSPGGIVCVVSENNCMQSDPVCFDVEVRSIPTATFTIDSPICEDGTATVSYTGNANDNASLIWNLDGGALISGNPEEGNFVVQWPASGTYNVGLEVIEFGCPSVFESNAITVDPAVEEIVLTCNSTTSSVEFTWNSIPGATGYEVNGTVQSGNSLIINNLTAGETASITVLAIVDGACSASPVSLSCTADDCPNINIQLIDVNPQCEENTNPFNLETNTPGGIWSGTGIIDATLGTFDPLAASLGSNTITYTISNGNCSYSNSLTIEVEASLSNPEITCTSSTDQVSFEWGTVDGAVAYIVNGVSQIGTSIEMTNLLPGEEVSITVEAVSAGACGNSSSQATCVAENCPAINIQLIDVNAQCEENTNPFNLETNTPSGTWSGVGIIDATLGTFDPSAASLGSNTITYTVSNGNCTYTNSLTIEVEASLSSPEITCTSSTDQVSFEWGAVDGAVAYIVNGVSQIGTSIEMSNLLPGEEVSITVEAVSAGACGNSSSQATCVAEDCPAINIQLIDVNTQCEENTNPFNLETNTPGGTWSGTGITDASLGTFDPSAASLGSNTITYTVSNGNCTYSNSLTIEVEASLSTPEITCTSTTDQVSFEWGAVDGAVAYIVNGVSQIGTSIEMTNLLPGEEVSITVEAVSAGACGNSSNQSTCIAEDCPAINIQLIDVNAQCEENTNPFNLETNTPGGTWSGTGITDGTLGTFDPSAAALGSNTITYTISNGNCSYSNSLTIEVEALLSTPEITCTSTTDQVSFEWGAVDGAVAYIVNGVSQIGTSIEMTNLLPGEEVSITVEAVSAGACGNSSSQATCVAEDCPTINIQLTDVNEQCEENTNPFNLETNTPGGTWSGAGITDATLGTFDPSAASLGSNTITYTVSNGPCGYSESLEIEVNEQLAGPEVNCNSAYDQVSFDWLPVAGASGYLVNGVEQAGTTFNMDNLSPGTSVTIIVEAIGTNACGNSSTSLTCSTNDCQPVSITFTPVESLCLNDLPSASISLEAVIQGGSGQGQGLWSGPGIIDAVNGVFDPNAINVNPGANEIIYLYEDGACSENESFFINVNEAPAIEAGESPMLNCAIDIVSLSGSGEGSSMWSGPGIISGADTESPMINAPGIYILTRTNPTTGCTATDEVEVFENIEAPTALSGEDQLLTCDNPEGQLSSIGNTGGNLIPEWEGPGINLSNVNSPTPIVDVPGVYILTILNTENGCVSTPDSVFVMQNTIPPLAEISVIGNLDCSGNPVIAQAVEQSGNNYSWIAPDGNTLNQGSIEVFEEGVYILQVTSGLNGCTSTQEINIENNASNPNVDAGIDKEINCLITEIDLQGTVNSNGNYNYLWTGPSGGISGPTDQLAINAVLEGMYIFKVTNLLNSCQSEDTVYVTSDLIAPTVEAGQPQEFGCNDQDLSLDGTVSSDADAYMWVNENEEVIALTLNTEINSPGWYQLIATNNQNGCTAKDSVFISVDQDVPYDVVLNTQAETCYGDRDGWIAIENVLGGSAPYEYSFNGSNFYNVSNWPSLEGGTYNLIVKDADGCIHEKFVVLPQTPELIIDLGPDIVLELGQSQHLFLETNIDEYQLDDIYWTPTDAISCMNDDCMEILISPLNTFDLQVMLMDTSGCMAEDEIQVRVKKNRGVFIPNIFTPNNDLINDMFYIQGLPTVKTVTKFIVVDRWGEQVFENTNFDINDPSEGWDGSFKGEALQSGVFVFYVEVEFVDGYIATFKGDVTLVR